MAFKTGQAANLVWRQHVEAFKKSGLTRPAYCRKHRYNSLDVSIDENRAIAALSVTTCFLLAKRGRRKPCQNHPKAAGSPLRHKPSPIIH